MKENDTQIDETLPAIDATQQQAESGDTAETPADCAPTEQTAPTDNDDSERIAKLVAEAEQRGYMRGLNERLTEQMNRPGLYEDLARRAAGPSGNNPAPTDDPLTSGFLSAVRASVWD